MAFTVLPACRGKHRRARRGPGRTGVAIAGFAVLSAAGALGATAMAASGQAPSAAPAGDTVLTQAVDVTGGLARTVSGQAAAQRQAATERDTADQARRKAAAKTKARARALAQARAAAAARARARAAVAAKAAAERAERQAAARSARRAALAAAWTTPAGDAPIGTRYHAAGGNWSSGYHTGVDFLVGSGAPVRSVAAGTVVFAGYDGSYGTDVIIRHADGRYTLYGHLSQALVSAGQTVAKSRQIGVSGATGNVTGPHLHFEVRTTPDYGSDIDPVAYLRSHGVVI